MNDGTGVWKKLKNEIQLTRHVDILVVARVQLSAEPHEGVRFIFVAVITAGNLIIIRS